MLIIKENGLNTLTFTRNTVYGGNKNYSILVQNTVTKDIYVMNVTDVGNALYTKFEIDVKLPAGEYYTLLFENPEHLPFKGETNNPNDIVTIQYLTAKGKKLNIKGKTLVQEYIKYVTNGNDIIMYGDFYIVFDNEQYKIDFVSSDLLRVGEYKSPQQQYRKEQGYITYNK